MNGNHHISKTVDYQTVLVSLMIAQYEVRVKKVSYSFKKRHFCEFWFVDLCQQHANTNVSFVKTMVPHVVGIHLF